MLVRVRFATAEAEASRIRTWQNHSQHNLLTRLHRLCRSLSNLRTRSRGYRKPDIPMRRTCASWSIATQIVLFAPGPNRPDAEPGTDNAQLVATRIQTPLPKDL